jgi:Domain of unknown function (DUF3067)
MLKMTTTTLTTLLWTTMLLAGRCDPFWRQQEYQSAVVAAAFQAAAIPPRVVARERPGKIASPHSHFWWLYNKIGDEQDELLDDGNDDLSLEAFQRARAAAAEEKTAPETANDDDGDVATVPTASTDDAETEGAFDGYDLRDIIYAKWGQCYDVEFQKVDTMGFRKVYLNIMPFHLGRRPFRHSTEYDYLCHLQAVVEILQDYGQLNYVLYQIGETKKRPLPGRSPIVAVPCRLDLTDEQVNSIFG